jgi:hypothetical protein
MLRQADIPGVGCIEAAEAAAQYYAPNAGPTIPLEMNAEFAILLGQHRTALEFAISYPASSRRCRSRSWCCMLEKLPAHSNLYRKRLNRKRPSETQERSMSFQGLGPPGLSSAIPIFPGKVRGSGG